MKLELELDYEDVIRHAMDILALGRADEWVGGGRLENLVQFLL